MNDCRAYGACVSSVASAALGWAAAAACGCSARDSALHPGGPQADRILELFWLFTAVALGVYLAVVLVLALALLLERRSTGGEGSQRAVRAQPSRRLVWAVTGASALTVVLLFVLLIASVGTGRALSSVRAPELTIEVVGHQWWWQVTYPDPQPSLRVTTANEIHVPVGKRVAFRLTSNDVIHSFWVPRLHGKRDLIPGHEAWLVLQVDRPGTYRGRCAEFCGFQHAHMELVIVAQPPHEFEQWLAHQRRPAPPAITEEQQRGQALFVSGSCALCHAISGTPAGAGSGPDLTHLKSRAQIAAAILPNTREHLREWVRDPQRIKPGSNMPANPWPERDLDALLAYLESLR
jgi:cytochrome c oxidase subunit II